MTEFISQKRILAKPMNRGEYNAYRGWEVPADENPADEGYLVEYVNSPNSNHPDHKGYISWSPKIVFEESHRVSSGLNIGDAIEALKQGKRVKRASWNEYKRFLFMQVPSDIPANVVPKMQSLPDSVKKFFNWTFTEESNEQIDAIYYNDQIALVKPTNTIVGYAFTPEDVLAEDWQILD